MRKQAKWLKKRIFHDDKKCNLSCYSKVAVSVNLLFKPRLIGCLSSFDFWTTIEDDHL